MIKFYCHDHEELLCSVCVALKHQATHCKVNYIPDISGNIIDSKEYQHILKAVSTTSDQYRKMVEDVKKKTVKSNSSLSDTLAEIKKFRQEINQRLDKLERKTVNAAEIIHIQNDRYLQSVQKICEDIATLLQASSEMIRQVNTSKQANKLFVELKLAEKNMKNIEAYTPELMSYEIREHNFIPNEAILTQVTTEKTLGIIIEENLNKKSTCVKTPDDESMCCITGMTLHSPDLLIITDSDNRAVKVVNTRNELVCDRLQLDVAPWDTTLVSSSELAVTLPHAKMIQFLSISSNKLEKKHTVKVDGKCYGIIQHQDKLVVSFLHPARLQILDVNGFVLKNIDISNNSCTPFYVTCDSSSIYLSDCDVKSVKRFNWQGEETCSYDDARGPYGIALSGEGTIFVCDWERNVIREVSGDCYTGIDILKDLKCPQGLC
jgi:hypothetical protein